MTGEKERLAYLSVLAKHGKSPFDILLDVIEAGCYPDDFTSFDTIPYDRLAKDIENRCDVPIQSYTLRLWLQNFFRLDGTKLALKSKQESLANRMVEINADEQNFSAAMVHVRGEFVAYCREKFGLGPDAATKEWAKKVFDGYTFSVASNKSLDNSSKSPDDDTALPPSDVFMFRSFLVSLYKDGGQNARDSLDVIENYGVANQIQDIVSKRNAFDSFVNADDDEGDTAGVDIADTLKEDGKFLSGCRVFVDTPLMMRLLGYDGKALSQAYKEFFAALRQAGAVLRMFSHTLSLARVYYMRQSDNIDPTPKTTTYKDAKYFLLVGNYTIVKAVMDYYKSSTVFPHKNEVSTNMVGSALQEVMASAAAKKEQAAKQSADKDAKIKQLEAALKVAREERDSERSDRERAEREQQEREKQERADRERQEHEKRERAERDAKAQALQRLHEQHWRGIAWHHACAWLTRGSFDEAAYLELLYAKDVSGRVLS